MSFKSLVCAGFLCGLMVAPVAAQPGISVDLVRSGGLPVLSANGNWQWAVTVNPDAFSSAIDVELGIQMDVLTGATLGDAIWDTSNPGSSIFGWETTDGSDDDGLQVNTGMGQAVIFVGSDVFAASSGSSLLATIEGGPPTTAASATPASTSIDIMGAYMGDGITVGGSNAIVAQQTSTGPDVVTTVAVSLSDSAEAAAGDTNMNGVVDLTDLVANLSPNFGAPGPHTWNGGDFNNSDTVDLTDLVALLSPNFGQAGLPVPGGGAGSSAAVPEPTSTMLVLLGVMLAGIARVRR